MPHRCSILVVLSIARFLLLLGLLLILSLPLLVLFLVLLRRITHQLALVVDPRPLWLAVIDVEDTSWVEHMAAVIRKRQQCPISRNGI